MNKIDSLHTMKSLFRCALLFDFLPMCLFIISSNSDKILFPILINKITMLLLLMLFYKGEIRLNWKKKTEKEKDWTELETLT